LRESMGNAVSFLQAAVQFCEHAENCERFEKLVKLAKNYAATAAEMTALKRDYAEIARPLEQVYKIGTEIDALIEKATSVARSVASQRMAVATARITRADRDTHTRGGRRAGGRRPGRVGGERKGRGGDPRRYVRARHRQHR